MLETFRAAALLELFLKITNPNPFDLKSFELRTTLVASISPCFLKSLWRIYSLTDFFSPNTNSFRSITDCISSSQNEDEDFKGLQIVPCPLIYTGRVHTLSRVSWSVTSIRAEKLLIFFGLLAAFLSVFRSDSSCEGSTSPSLARS